MCPVGSVTCIINVKSYDSFLLNQVIQTLQQRACLYRIIFMQDDTLLYAAKPVMQMLKRHFGKNRINGCHRPTA